MTKKNTKHMKQHKKTLKNTGPHNVPLSLSKGRKATILSLIIVIIDPVDPGQPYCDAHNFGSSHWGKPMGDAIPMGQTWVFNPKNTALH